MRPPSGAFALVLLAGCGGGTPAVETAPDPVVSDAPSPGLVEFLRHRCCGRGSEYPPGPATVSVALGRSSLVVLAGVLGLADRYPTLSALVADIRAAAPRRPH